MPKHPRNAFYAVAIGRIPGIYHSWEECRKQTNGFKAAKFKSFPTEHEALAFWETYRTPPPCDEHPSIAAQSRGGNGTDLDIISNKKRKIKMKKYKIMIVIHFDGGSRGNPGLSGSGAELRVSEISMSNTISTSCHTTTTTEDETEVCSRTLHLLKFLGQRSTNNEAEYHALLLALEEALNQIRGFAECHGLADDCVANLIVKGDSDLVIKQILGKYRVQSHTLLPLYHKSKNLIKSIQQVMDCHMEFLHIPRGENEVADGLANQAMETQTSSCTVIKSQSMDSTLNGIDV